MKWIIGTVAIAAWFALWFLIFAGNYSTYAGPRPEPVIVPHCHSPMIGMFLPCSDVDRYEYA